MYITETQKKIKIAYEADLCVIGGSCTGLFAAVRAARLGASVVLVEMQGCLGGVATNGLVNMWHNLYDLTQTNQIISGLTEETLERLERVNALTVVPTSMSAYRFNSNDLKIELDNYILENKIKLYLHSQYSSVIYEEGLVEGIVIQTKEGRLAIKAKFFIDATGDGDVARDLGISSYTHSAIQPPTACFIISGEPSEVNDLIKKYGSEVGISNDDWGWWNKVAGCEGLFMSANTHVFNVMCNKADDLTASEIEGRRLARGVQTLLKKYGCKDFNYGIASLCNYIGVRETVHYETLYKATGEDILNGKKHQDAIMNGTYPIDIHNVNGGFVIQNINSDYYQLPLRSIINENYDNFIAVGRMMNADSAAFGALRVMVNLNQMGEAAGVAAYLSLNSNCSAKELDGIKVRELLKQGGSVL